MRKFLCFTVAAILVSSCVGCGAKEEPVVIEKVEKKPPARGSYTGNEHIDHSYEDDEPAAEDPPAPKEEPVIENATSEEAVMSEGPGSMSYGDCITYMLASGSDNSVFSLESLKCAADMYSHLLTEEGKTAYKECLGGIDYMSYKGNDAFRIVNRLWVNKNKDLNLKKVNLGKVVYEMDMSDAAKATAEKDKFVSDSTDGFIESTPTEFNSDVVVDAMNVLYFKDTWDEGDKELDDVETDFNNLDGSKTAVKMFCDYGKYVTTSANAMCYTMPYTNGFTFSAILPAEGYDVSDVDIDMFISGDAETKHGDVNFKMPEFETESVYTADLLEFGFPSYSIDHDIYPTEVDTVVTQVAKIRVDHEGTEAAAVSEIMVMDAMAVIDESEQIDMICDRPFLYYIYDTINNDVAFIGIVQNLSR